MTPDFLKAHIAGVERIAAWSDVLDNINVFPVADGDTGRNLITSLMPLRYLKKDLEDTIHKLLLSARGNSGNIAVQFFSGFLTADSYASLTQAAKSGRDQAWQAVSKPIP
jgi:dihydroxyacetone kinase-like predicted kinase